VIGTIVLLLCLAAGAVAAGILFVVLGPVPVNRRVTMVSRIIPMPVAAGPVAMPGMPVFDPAAAAFPPGMPFDPAAAAFTPPRPLPVIPDPFAHRPTVVAAVESQPVAARKAKPLPPIAPAQLRRPRTTPAPLARTRSARGTGPRHTAFDVEHTAAEAPMFELDDPTLLEDGH
jgi:hypothetical protein